jgi:L-lactate utilization protein LutB
LSEAKAWYQKFKIKRVVEALKNNGFDVLMALNGEEALEKVLTLIPPKSLVGVGGSVTLREIGLPEALRKRGNRVADHWRARESGATRDELREIMRLHPNSDVFVASSNAVTEKGELVNTDGGGQRVASMIFGPKKVILVVGANKIVGSIEEGFEKIRNIVAPLHHKRRGWSTPCAATGVCVDCASDDSGCRVTSIIHRRPRHTDITIVMVEEALGY